MQVAIITFTGLATHHLAFQTIALRVAFVAQFPSHALTSSLFILWRTDSGLTDNTNDITFDIFLHDLSTGKFLMRLSIMQNAVDEKIMLFSLPVKLNHVHDAESNTV